MGKSNAIGFLRGFAGMSAAFSVLSLLLPAVSRAVPANPSPIEVSQPDGTMIRIVLRGDEFHKWQEDENGYAVLKDASTGEWSYAVPDGDGALKPGGHRVGAGDPASLGIPKNLTDRAAAAGAKTMRAQRDASSAFRISGKNVSGAPSRTPVLSGTMKNLVILARFADVGPARTPAEFSDLFNQAGYSANGAVGSVQDYFKEVSYNTLTVQSTVYAWVTLPQNAAFYGANTGAAGTDVNPRQMVVDAINAVDTAGFDFKTVDGNGDGEVDGLTIIHSGPGEESTGVTNQIWSHQWYLAFPLVKDDVSMQLYHTEAEVRGAGPLIATIGTICHETAHFLGLPDLYDTTDASAGIGRFCLMAQGSWNGPGNDGSSPAHPSAWCKKNLGWAAATQPLTSGAYTLPRIEDNPLALYLLRSPAFPSTEYFLVENRQLYGFDAYLPGISSGTLIWHVDESMPNNDDRTHYLVDLEEADGIQNMELNPASLGTAADYFRSDNKTTFGDATVPGSKTYNGTSLGIFMSGISATGNPMTFNLSGVEASLAVLNSMGNLKAYPNPCYFDRAPFVLNITGMPLNAQGTRVYIYNTAGELVRTLQQGDGIDASNKAAWNGRDRNGAKAASGLYIYLAKTANVGSATGKFYIFQ